MKLHRLQNEVQVTALGHYFPAHIRLHQPLLLIFLIQRRFLIQRPFLKQRLFLIQLPVYYIILRLILRIHRNRNSHPKIKAHVPENSQVRLVHACQHVLSLRYPTEAELRNEAVWPLVGRDIQDNSS